MIAKVAPRSSSSVSERQPVAVTAGRPSATAHRNCWVDITLRGFLAVVMVWAGLSKIVDPASFYGAILAYQLPLPQLFLKGTAVIIPWLEIFCGLLLVANTARRATLVLVLALFTVFLAVVGQAFFRGLNISCGCFDLSPFGIPQASKLGLLLESTGFAILRNLGLLAAALVLWKTTAPVRSDPADRSILE